MEPVQSDYFDREVCKPFYHRGNDCGVLLVHGFTGSASHMRILAEGLAGRGYTVQTINLPGHATSESDMAKSDWQQWLQSVKKAALDLMNETSVTAVGGLSMGGVLSLLAAEQMKIDACIPISAPMATKNRLLPLSGIVAPLIPRISWSSSQERVKALDQAYDFGYNGFPTAKGADLYKLIRLARQNLFNINCPILCVQSDADETIWEGSADTILEGVSSEVRQKLWLKGVPHVCTISREAPAIIDAMDGLLKRVTEEKTAEQSL